MLKNPLRWPFFPSFFDNSWGHGPSTFGTFPQKLYNHYNHAHAPGQHNAAHTWPSPAHCLGPWPDSKCSKTVQVGCSCSELKPCQRVRCSCSELKPCQREIATDEIQKKKYRERSNIKASVSVDWRPAMGSVPLGVAEGQHWVSAPCENRTRVSRLTATHLNH